MNWDRNKIFTSIFESADKYGSSNPQQMKQLHFALSKCNPQELYSGIMSVFHTCHKNFSERQELAGWLLYEILPNADFDIKTDLTKCLRNYELSVEQLPYFFINKVGKEEFEKIINSIDERKLSEDELRALGTIKYWARNYEQFKQQHG